MCYLLLMQFKIREAFKKVFTDAWEFEILHWFVNTTMNTDFEIVHGQERMLFMSPGVQLKVLALCWSKTLWDWLLQVRRKFYFIMSTFPQGSTTQCQERFPRSTTPSTGESENVWAAGFLSYVEYWQRDLLLSHPIQNTEVILHDWESGTTWECTLSITNHWENANPNHNEASPHI